MTNFMFDINRAEGTIDCPFCVGEGQPSITCFKCNGHGTIINDPSRDRVPMAKRGVYTSSLAGWHVQCERPTSVFMQSGTGKTTNLRSLKLDGHSEKSAILDTDVLLDVVDSTFFVKRTYKRDTPERVADYIKAMHKVMFIVRDRFEAWWHGGPSFVLLTNAETMLRQAEKYGMRVSFAIVHSSWSGLVYAQQARSGKPGAPTHPPLSLESMHAKRARHIREEEHLMTGWPGVNIATVYPGITTDIRFDEKGLIFGAKRIPVDEHAHDVVKNAHNFWAATHIEGQA